MATEISPKTRLIMQVFEDHHGDYDNADTRHFAEIVQAISRREVNECCLCSHIGIDVNHLHSWHVGGESDPQAPCCDDGLACGKRVDLAKGTGGM